MTRQPAYATLRATAFAHLSAQHPTAPRKLRRAAARLAARGLQGQAMAELGDPEPPPRRDAYGSVTVTREQWHHDPQWAEVRATQPDPFVVGTIEWDEAPGDAPGRD